MFPKFPALWFLIPHLWWRPFPHAAAATSASQTRLNPERSVDEKTLRIAIVGSGVAGTTAAFTLWESFSTLNVSQPKITIFEADSRIGGRIKTVHMPTEPGYEKILVDVGADAISPEDSCLLGNIRHIGLADDFSVSWKHPECTAVWNGTHLVEGEPLCHVERPKPEFCLGVCVLEKLWWSAQGFVEAMHINFGTLAAVYQWILPHNSSGRRFYATLVEGLQRWSYFPRYSHYPFKSVSDEIRSALKHPGLLETGSEYLQSANVSQVFSNRVVQPCTRAAFGLDVANVRGLETILASGLVKSPKYLNSGMSSMLKRMITLSGSLTSLNSKVTAIHSGSQRRFQVTLESPPESVGNPGAEADLEFDFVIIATPLPSQANIPADDPPELPQVHMTAFRSEFHLSPKFFSPTTPVAYPREDDYDLDLLPSRILTTSDNLTGTYPSENLEGILKIRSTRHCLDRYCDNLDDGDLCDCHSCRDEFVYRVLSRHRLDDKDIMHLFGDEPPPLDRWIVGATPRPRHGDGEDDLVDYGVSWIHREEWPGSFVPIQDRNNIPGDIDIAPGLLHVGGGAVITDTMEMACRMGRNAAWSVLQSERESWRKKRKNKLADTVLKDQGPGKVPLFEF